MLLTTTLSVVSIATSETSVNVVTPSLLLAPPVPAVVPALSFLKNTPPEPGVSETSVSVFTRAVSPSATYAKLPPTVALALTLMSPSVAVTYLSAVAFTAAFSDIPFDAFKVTLTPLTPAPTVSAPSVASSRMFWPETLTASAAETVRLPAAFARTSPAAAVALPERVMFPSSAVSSSDAADISAPDSISTLPDFAVNLTAPLAVMLMLSTLIVPPFTISTSPSSALAVIFGPMAFSSCVIVTDLP